MPFLAPPPRFREVNDIPSSISQLFRTNAVPSAVDTERIHILIEERQAELAAFEHEIDLARARMQALEDQRSQVQDVVHELHALISPVRRMPTDVMANIFEHCIWDQAFIPTTDPRISPLLLGQVCRSWRYLLFSLPCLWTTLQLDFPTATKDWEALVRSKCLSMHVWLARSKALPISLILNHPKGSMIPWHAVVYLDKEILSLASRLKDLSLHFSARSLASLLTLTQSPLPRLEHLELHNSNSLPTSENPPPIVLHSAPRLRSLSLSWCSLDLHSFQVPWAQLHHLDLSYSASAFWNPVHSDYLQTLASCHNLTTLSLGVGAVIHELDPTYVPPVVTLPHVHTFKTRLFVQTRYLEHLFESLRMPALRHFEFANAGLALGSFAGQTECLPFLARCADTLEEVCWNRADIPDAAVVACLMRLHHLKRFSYLPGILRLNHGLVGALTGKDERVCSALEVLELRCAPGVPVDAIVQLVASRVGLRRFALQLATFEYGLDTRDEKIKEVRARLGSFVDAGLELVLTKTSSSAASA